MEVKRIESNGGLRTHWEPFGPPGLVLDFFGAGARNFWLPVRQTCIYGDSFLVLIHGTFCDQISNLYHPSLKMHLSHIGSGTTLFLMAPFIFHLPMDEIRTKLTHLVLLFEIEPCNNYAKRSSLVYCFI